jgi:nucleoside-diphosphate-sugar epimerase
VKAAVTGASGFVGRWLVEALLQEGWDVDAISRRALPPRKGVRSFPADLSDPPGYGAVLRACGPVDVLFHLAAARPTHRPAPDDEAMVRANALSALRLFEEALEMRTPRVVFASSISVIGTPAELPVTERHSLAPRASYAVSKLAGEMYAELIRATRGLSIASLRLTSCYGPGMGVDSVLPYFVQSALDGRRVAWFGEGGRTQNFLHVKDAARAFMLAARSTAVGVFHIGGPESVSMRDLAEMVVALTGSRAAAGAAGKPDPQEAHRWELDLRHAAAALGYVPAVRIREGLEEYIAHAAGVDLRHSR